ncbi:putative phage abortive infection protein [Aeromonas veronii]|uniref:putative phage abortive infection protein n=1 Tax=Aeromonas veronii TaxID=654 RepID=UPI001F2ABCD9|nr:putative phage abortive infection protein [Aeromonas veronii]MCF5858503.1 putative phage abortive infection protein [Aeromonas veronii]
MAFNNIFSSFCYVFTPKDINRNYMWGCIMKARFYGLCKIGFKLIELIRTHFHLSFLLVFLFVFSMWLFYPDLVWYIQGRSSVTAYSGLGEFGDMFGSLNTLFSGLAFSAVVATLLLQKQQLAISQQELRLTRDEMATQSDLFSIQTEVMNQQLFEGTFFQLVKFYLEKTSMLSSTNNHGDKRWHLVYGILDQRVNNVVDKGLCYSGYDEAMSYPMVRSIITPLSLFFKILKYIDESNLISDEKKKFYVELLKSNITDVEVYFIAVVAAYDEKFNEYKPYIEKYALLNILDLEYELPINVFCEYKMSAYKSLRTEVFDSYISTIVLSEFYNGLFDFGTDEIICDLKFLSRADYRAKYFGNYNCIIR